MIIIFATLFATDNAKASEARIIKDNKESVNGLRSVDDLTVLQIFDLDKHIKRVPEGNPTYDEIKEAVRFASKVTGVREGFLMGMLAMESDFGKNTGECTYEEVEAGAKNSYSRGLLSQQAWNTFQERRETIKGITNGLGYDYKKIKVSCNPARYAGTGGALGIPQFMPDTWLEYKERVSNVVGKENPDPWDPKDGITAMALKLSDVYGVTNHNILAERNAAKLYLSGTTSWQYNWYANQVVYWSERNSVG